MIRRHRANVPFTLLWLLAVAAGLIAGLAVFNVGIAVWKNLELSRLKIGMRPEEVERLLGPPRSARAENNSDFWDRYEFLGTHYVAVRVHYDNRGTVDEVSKRTFWRAPAVWQRIARTWSR